jgi:hypothetical protein
MINKSYSDIVSKEMIPECSSDYHVIACLLKKLNPKSIFEIGTGFGIGVNVIGAACPEAKIFSLDLDYDSMIEDPDEYLVIKDGKDMTGSVVTVGYTQLRGDSMFFNFKEYPCQAYIIDGCHDGHYVYVETMKCLRMSPDIVIFNAIETNGVQLKDIVSAHQVYKNGENIIDYELCRVDKTRIAYLIKKELQWDSATL